MPFGRNSLCQLPLVLHCLLFKADLRYFEKLATALFTES